jgi:poly(hydroxyalkanoate) granule-associated protein
MANKRIKHRTSTSADTAHTLWLAGLGALSITQKRGGTLLAGLIAEGRDFQGRARRLAQEVGADAQAQIKGAIAPLRMHARDNAKKVGALIERTVALALRKFGVPSKADIEALSQRMGALSRQLKAVK